MFSPRQHSVQASVEQIFDIPVPGGAHDFLPEPRSTAFCRDGGGGLQGFFSEQGSTAFHRDRGPGGGPQGFFLGQSSAASCRDGELVEVFKIFSQDRFTSSWWSR